MPRRNERDILSAKPAKKSFVFEVRKRFAHVRKFIPAAPPKLDASTIAGLLGAYLRRRRGDRQAEEEFRHRTAPMTKVLLGRLMFILIALFVIALLLVGAFFFIVLSAPPPPPPQPVVVAPTVSYSVQKYDVLSFGPGSEYAAFATVPMQGRDVQEVRLHLDLFADEVPQDIFLLKSRREQATQYAEFKKYLEAELAKQGLRANELHIDQLRRLPRESRAVIIVPSGFFPAVFLGLVDPDFDVRTLLGQGNVIIYMGHGFDRGAIFEREGRVRVNADAAAKRLGFGIGPPTGAHSEDGYNLRDPQYSIVPVERELPLASVHGSMYSVNIGSGYMLFLPQPLDSGWLNGAQAAQDVARLIQEAAWQRAFRGKLVAVGEKRVAAANGSVSANPLLLSTPYPKQNAWGRLQVSVVGLDNRTYGRTIFLKYDNVVRGQLRHSTSALPTELSGQRLTVSGEFNEPESVWRLRKPVNVYLVFYNSTSRVSSRLMQAEPVIPTALYPISADVEITVPSGDYYLRVEDEDGNVFAQSYLRVPEINITKEVQNFGAGYFSFDVKADGVPADLRNVRVSLDGLQETVLATRESRVTSGARVLEYVFQGRIGEGEHAFLIEYAGQKTTITGTYTFPKNWWDNPLMQVGLVFTAIIFVMGVLLRRPEPVMYGIDVPDFPPTAKVLIPLPPKTVTDLFDTLEAEYGWKYMPLEPRELKNGFRKVVYKGRGILIGDYNLEKLLEKLEAKGLVESALGLWGLKKWVQESRKSMRYLAVFRKLRTIFVNNAVKFTDFGERQDCDTAISIPETVFVHIYDGDAVLPRVLASAQKGASVLVFADNLEREVFKRKLYSPEPLLVALKLMKDQGRLVLTDTEWFERKIIKKEKAGRS
ncbi:MAG: hypothetical protein QXH27_01175 [Candidatus Micrarchaeia archaeon]